VNQMDAAETSGVTASCGRQLDNHADVACVGSPLLTARAHPHAGCGHPPASSLKTAPGASALGAHFC
jgi:hypothetical protein